jgi:hypothetical protein
MNVSIIHDRLQPMRERSRENVEHDAFLRDLTERNLEIAA